jgi:RND family efflux transporter MFP subunit
MNPNVDLRQLAVRREQPSGAPAARRPRRWLTRMVLPAAVLVGFVAVTAWAARDSLLPSRPVTVVPVLTTHGEVSREGQPLFQSAGWVEPRPTPVLVPALTEGIVDKLLVVEGQEVKAGAIVATLIDTDAKLALKMAEADLRLRLAELESAKAARTAAAVNFEKPTHLQAGLAEAEAMLAQKETERALLPAQRRAAEAKRQYAQLEVDRKNVALGALPELMVSRAQNELELQDAALEELKSRTPMLGKEVEALRQKRDTLRQRLELKTEEARQKAEADAQVEAAAARVQQAQAALDTAQLRLDRMNVKSPVAGRVLGLQARPGARVMGISTSALIESTTVVSLYDPARLQVRADVRLENVPQVQAGQRVMIETPAAPGGPLLGEVLFPTSQADIQKNTLQVKVAITEPPTTLRPDMLVQVTFLAVATSNVAKDETPSRRLLVPRALVENSANMAFVWVADQTAGVARRRTIQLGQAANEGLVEVTEGLKATDKVIASGRDGLSDGGRITVTGEEPAPAPSFAPAKADGHHGNH